MAALDAWLIENEKQLLEGRGAIVDVGYGESPVTTLELARALRSSGRDLRIVGIEREARADLEVELLAGDFNTCGQLAPTAVVRAMNVLRGYREEEVPAIHAALGAGLVEGGLVIEGSTDTDGHVTVVWLLRKRSGGLAREALLFHTDFERGFSPWLFRDWLPRDLRRRAQPGTAVHSLLSRWDEQATGATPRERFVNSVPGVLTATAWEMQHGFARCPAPLLQREAGDLG